MEKAAVPATGLSPRRGSFSFFGQTLNWLFSQRHFHIKLLSGTVAGVIVIVFLAGVFLLVTYRNHIQEALRTHTIAVMRLSSVVEKDIAALETGHRGFLLTGNPTYREAFEQRREEIKRRIDDLAALILNSPPQRKRVIKVQELVQTWAVTVAEPEMNARPTKPTPPNAGFTLGNSILDQARDILQSLQNEEQIILNQRIRDQEWAAQYTQILDLLPKLERSVVEMEKEKRGFLLTGDTAFFEAYRRAAASFVSYHGYLSILVANDPDQASLLTAIRENVEKWVAS
ncbi:MAG: CHASE3 domain-containing protein, partial [Verrucomicrobiota bacterium]|nr:CHASE3 domain-containing protein [Verrucomicrobiota bacterium]